MKWLTLPDNRKREIINNINFKTGLSLTAIEKDLYVTISLLAVFQTTWANEIVFKGGTSLSKGWKLISRFSEDVDLAISPAALGIDPATIVKSGDIKKLRKKNKLFMEGPFLEGLTKQVRAMGITQEMLEVKICPAKASDDDPRIIQMEFPSLYPENGNYIKKSVDLEIGARSLREPFAMRSIISLVDEHLPDVGTGIPAFEVPTVTPDRTFLEKIWLLHENFTNTPDKMRHFRMSRHLYDLYYVSESEFGKSALQDTELFETIRKHRSLYNDYPHISYPAVKLQEMIITPPDGVQEHWEKDYAEMRVSMMTKDPPEYAEILQRLAMLHKKDAPESDSTENV